MGEGVGERPVKGGAGSKGGMGFGGKNKGEGGVGWVGRGYLLQSNGTVQSKGKGGVLEVVDTTKRVGGRVVKEHSGAGDGGLDKWQGERVERKRVSGNVGGIGLVNEED
ncbi:hypothetical protein VNO78_17405 [Psophocarpus tetragonolobus]|uniref:Uncharacterized protein n=1 Tax=Psophocarpus tetragonolobus TaxID=3891 RepID=A0AAN9SHX0_PSOTE